MRGVGIGFGGPVDDATHTVIKSHQIEGWDNFPLADWLSDVVGLPAALGNDADVAGLAEALHGAGKGLSPIFYITIGSGIGGGLIINGEIYRGVGRGAAEIGHLIVAGNANGRVEILEKLASGWGMEECVRQRLQSAESASLLRTLAGEDRITAKMICEAFVQGDTLAGEVFWGAIMTLAHAICQMIVLLCPRRIVIGGGVSLIGEEFFFRPLRHQVSKWVFEPFAELTDIVPAALGEEVVVHGALALARRQFEK